MRETQNVNEYLKTSHNQIIETFKVVHSMLSQFSNDAEMVELDTQCVLIQGLRPFFHNFNDFENEYKQLRRIARTHESSEPYDDMLYYLKQSAADYFI